MNRPVFFPCYAIVILLFFFAALSAKNNSIQLQTTQPTANDELLQRTLCNINNWSFWIYADGKSGNNPRGKAGGFFPRPGIICMYEDGLMWGALVNGKVILGGQTYRIGTRARLQRVYRIRYDWPLLTADDVRQDAATFFQVKMDSVTSQMETWLLKRYRYDWKNWPVDQGAPYVDVDHNGIYNPVLFNDGIPDASRGDYPGIRGAAQVIWLSVDDQDAGRMAKFYRSKPVGIREDVTIWAYRRDKNNPLSQMIFKKYKITNISKATTLNEMYLNQWSDPDIGEFYDDLVGCDSLLGSCFAYNYNWSDPSLDTVGIRTPVAGYVLLQGPAVPSAGDTARVGFDKQPGYRNLPMTVFAGYMPIPFDLYDPSPVEWYNLMRGYQRSNEINNTKAVVHKAGPHKGQPTKFPLNGDPLTGSGDVDGQGGNWIAADRQMNMISGPFNLKPGESQTMIVALIGAQGDEQTHAFTRFKNNVKYIKNSFYGLNDRDAKDLSLVYMGLKREYPKHTILEQNFPNPFNLSTKFHYMLYEPAHVELTIYNLQGRKIRVLQNGNQAEGDHTVLFDAHDLASGVYIYTLKIGQRTLSNKMLLLK